MPKPPRRKAPKPKPFPALKNAVTTIVVFGLWTQEEAAEYLNVSKRYLRDSACPKHELPGNGEKEQPLIRYKPEAVIAWADRWSTQSFTPDTKAA